MNTPVLYACLAGAVWGFSTLVPKWLPEFNPILLSSGRFILYGATSLLIALPLCKKLASKITLPDMLKLLQLALFGNLLYFILFCAAIRWLGISPTTLIVGVLPVTITLLGRHDADAMPTSRLYAPLSLIMLGIICINISAFTHPSGANTWNEQIIGVICAVGALLSWSTYALLNAHYLKQQSRYSMAEWSSLQGVMTGIAGGMIWLTYAAFTHDNGNVISADRWQTFWLVNLGLALGSSWLGSWLWNNASSRLPLSLAGQLVVVETLFSLLYGFIYMQRWPTPLEATAISLLVSGVYWAISRHHQPVAGDTHKAHHHTA